VIAYSYTVDGVSYTGRPSGLGVDDVLKSDTPVSGLWTVSDPGTAQRELDKYPKGKK
jgi:hypothetical protein